MTAGAGPSRRRAWLVRAALYLMTWLMIAGYDAADLPVGIATACLAAFASLRLMPPSRIRLRPGPTLRYAANFGWQSVRAGLQVAFLAFRPSLPLRPGFVRCQMHLPAGERQYAFCALASLLPGTLPTGFDEDGVLLVHGLDVAQPIAAEVAAEEALFSRMVADE